MEKTSIFYQLLFDFKVSRFDIQRYLFKLKHQKLLSRITLRKVDLKICSSLQNIRGILLNMYHEIKFFQVYSLQSVPFLCIRKPCSHSEI